MHPFVTHPPFSPAWAQNSSGISNLTITFDLDLPILAWLKSCGKRFTNSSAPESDTKRRLSELSCSTRPPSSNSPPLPRSSSIISSTASLGVLEFAMFLCLLGTSASMSLHYFNQWYIVVRIEGGAWEEPGWGPDGVAFYIEFWRDQILGNFKGKVEASNKLRLCFLLRCKEDE